MNPTTLRSRLFAAVAGGLLFAAVAQAQTTFTEGDVILAFRATSGTGNDRSFLINLGPATQFTLGNSVSLSLGTGVGQALATTFGIDWFTRFDLNTGRSAVQLSLFGTFRTGSGPGQVVTLFTSNQDATPYNRAGSSTQGVARTTILGVTNVFPGQTQPSGVTNGFIQLNNEVGAYADQQNGATSFGYFTPSNEVSTGNAIWFNQLVSNAAGGPGAVLGSFNVDGSGNVTFGAVPEPSTYAIGAVASAALLVAWRRRRLAQLA